MPMTSLLPDWVPWWGQLVLIVLAILFALAFLMMPFAVFGLKGRLDFLEAQLDDIHAELRMLAMRLPDVERAAARPVEPPQPVVQEITPARSRPVREPLPPQTAPRRPRAIDDWSGPSPAYDDGEDMPRRQSRPAPVRDADRSRSEPTLRWPPR